MNTVFALWKRGLKAFIRNKTGLIFSLIFPFFFVYVFGAIFKNDFIDNPIAYMLSGVIITTVFESALNLASSTVDDMVSGFMKEVLVSPAKRVYVALGQLLSAATVSTLQGILILVIGLFIGIKFTDWRTPLLVLFSMIFIGIVFSGAYIPLSMLPGSLRFVAYFNPMTYATAFFRMIVLEKAGLSVPELIKEGLVVEINGFAIVKTDFSRLNRSATDANALWG